MFYGRTRALKTSQFFSNQPPTMMALRLTPMPASDADPQASAAAPHPGDATYATVRSGLADGGNAGTVFSVGANCYKWSDAKSPP